ncbi:propanediol utilization microcompartment protein PduB, partial [Enterococcus sp. S181_ASV_20]|nr:propanediol utilization microcompartment protein PduB [Enterococcus sp. S181_ASV_20]
MANTDQKIEEIMKRVLAKMETGNEMKNTNGGDRKMIEKQCALTEFVGATEFGDTIGLVIA